MLQIKREFKNTLVILSIAKNLKTLHSPLGRFFAPLRMTERGVNSKTLIPITPDNGPSVWPRVILLRALF